MIEYGKINTLKVTGVKESGIALDGGKHGKIVLPKKEFSTHVRVNDNVEVFICIDSKGKMIATTRIPYAEVGHFALLKVLTSNSYGAFLDWGIQPDLHISAREQQKRMKQGESYIVFVYNEKNNQITASSKIDKFLKKLPMEFVEGQRVDLEIGSITPLGYKVIINHIHVGVLYRNEIFQILQPGQAIRGFIKRIREDGKIDVSLHKSGAREEDELTQKILKVLRENGGSLDISDKTTPAKISSLFSVSKKRFKKAIGTLYKKRMIMVDDHCIRLKVKSGEKSFKKPNQDRKRVVRKKIYENTSRNNKSRRSKSSR